MTAPAYHPIARAALLRRVRLAPAARLVLACAPAGYGKTVVLRQLQAQLEAEGAATEWLAMEHGDSDVARFAHRFTQALESLRRDGEAAFALFLDDFERVQNEATLELVRAAVVQLPPGARLVVAARSRPALGLARLRAHGLLLELQADDLRFSPGEAAELLAATAPGRLDAAAGEQLYRRTEGWPVALALLASALRHPATDAEAVARHPGSHQALADYLGQTVLDQQPAATRDFLLRTSVLRRLEPALCDLLAPPGGSAALAPPGGSAALLERLSAQGLLIAPLRGDAPAWTCHGVFAQYLRARLRREDAELARRLQRTASEWHAARGRHDAAIDHAIEAGEPARAAALLTAHAGAFLEQGRLRLLHRWLAALPPQAVEADARLKMAAIWTEAFVHSPRAAQAMLDAGLPAAGLDGDVRAWATALRPLLALLRDALDEAAATGEAALAQLPTGRPFADIVVATAVAHVLAVRGRAPPSQAALERARHTPCGTAFTSAHTETAAALLDLYQGRLQMAGARLKLVCLQAGGGANPAQGTAWAGMLYASTEYEAGRLDSARELLDRYRPLLEGVRLPDHVLLAATLAARLAFEAGDADEALRQLAQLEQFGHRHELPRLVAAAWLARAQLLLRLGRGLAAWEALGRSDLPGVWERVAREGLATHDLDDLALGRLRWQATQGDAAAAARGLAEQAVAARAAGRQRRLLKLGVLEAAALHRAGDVARALQVLAATLRHAQREGFVRLVIDEGPALLAPLQRLQRALREHPAEVGAQARGEPLLADFVHGLIAGLPASEPGTGTPGSTGQPALTSQELRVLQLVAEGHSNTALAGHLGISDSTVRTHLRTINLKLETHTRTQAVAAARRLALLR